MNKDQLNYCLGKAAILSRTKVNLAMALLTAYFSGQDFAEVKGVTDPILAMAVAGAGLSAFFSYHGIKRALFSDMLKTDRRYFDEIGELHDIGEVQIIDSGGLESLMKRTAKEEKLEWGTFLRFKTKKKKGVYSAVVSKIADSENMEAKGYILNRGQESISFNYEKALEKGYNGTHHYHPAGGTISFNIVAQDRLERFEKPSINLITFNTMNGSEIVGHDLKNVFIPVKRDDKSRLVRATSLDIFRYLATNPI